jgi:hypothetical protein
VTSIRVTGCPPYDGSYELDLERELTTREWGWIKRHAGYLPLALTDEAFGDPELVCVFAVIALRRAGRIEPGEVPRVYERLLDTPFGDAITFEAEEEEAEERPPPSSSSSSAATSGGASKASSGTPGNHRRATGTRGSGSSASARVTSAT